MKTIGLIGGMSWESTDLYYQKINQQVQAKRGGLNSAQIILYSVNFHIIEQFQRESKWDEAATYLANIAVKLELAGADVIGLCTNTMHKVATDIQKQCSIPLLHIADPTINAIQSQRLRKIGLLGTQFTMEQTFYISKFSDQNIEIVVPNADARVNVHQIIFNELCQGILRTESKKEFLTIIHSMIREGVEGIILGCTEIGLLIQQEDLNIPVFDTTDLHVNALVAVALNEL